MNCQKIHSDDFDFLINFKVSRKEIISYVKLHMKVATFLHDPECIFSNIKYKCDKYIFYLTYFYSTQPDNVTHIFRTQNKPTGDFGTS